MRNLMKKAFSRAILTLLPVLPFAGCLSHNGTEIPNELTGTLYTTSGAAAANAQVRLYPVGYVPGDSAQTAGFSAYTNASGRYVMKNVPAGEYNLMASGQNVLAFRDSILLIRGNLEIPADTLRPAGSLTATVRLQPQHSPQTVIVQVLGTQYYFNVPSSGVVTLGLPEGSYRLRVSTILPDYVPLFISATVRSERHDTLSEVLEPYYSGIPVVTGLTATADSAGIIRLKWNKTSYPQLQEYLVYRSIPGSTSTGVLLGSVSDTAFSDTVFVQDKVKIPRADQFAFTDTTVRPFEYRVRIRNTSDNTGSVFGSATATAVSPIHRYVSGRWTRVLENAPFQANGLDLTKLLVFKGKLWVILAEKKEVWSSPDGVSWVLAGDLPLPSSATVAGALVYQEKLWVLIQKDRNQEAQANSLWNSADGSDWLLVNDSLPIPPRTNCAFLEFQNKIWVIGGGIYSPLMALHNNVSVLNSSEDGITWTNAAPAANFYAGWLQGAAIFGGKMWLAGVRFPPDWLFLFENHLSRQAYLASSQDGSDWGLVEYSEFPGNMIPRKAHAMTSHQGRLWMIGGFTYANNVGTDSNLGVASAEVWSSPDGVNWNLIDFRAPFGPRTLTGAVSFQNKLWVVGGRTENGTATSDVWYYE